MLQPHRASRTVTEDRKINFSNWKECFLLCCSEKHIEIVWLNLLCKKKKKSLHFPVRWSIEGLRVYFPDSERHCLFAWNNWITCFYDRSFEIEINPVPTNVVLVKLSIRQESSRNNHCSVKNLYHKFPVQPKDLDTICHRNQYYLVCAPSVPRDFSALTKAALSRMDLEVLIEIEALVPNDRCCIHVHLFFQRLLCILSGPLLLELLCLF